MTRNQFIAALKILGIKINLETKIFRDRNKNLWILGENEVTGLVRTNSKFESLTFNEFLKKELT